MAEVVGIIGSVVGILTATDAAYNKIKSMKGLPEAFAEVALRVPLAQQMMSDIEARSRDAPESAIGVLLPVINSCKGNAQALKTTLEKLDLGDPTTAWSLDKYISLIKSRGKKGRVEDLMKKILQDIYTLASHKTINAATSEQLDALKEAVELVGNAKKSAPDEMLEEFGKVSISHGGQGPMLNQVGDHNTAWNNFGSGHINNISGNAHFGLTPGQRRREALRLLNCASYEDHKNRNPEAMANTCKWFTEHPAYRSWTISMDESFLWVSADPGCGKSVLARHLIDHELKASGIIYFFFKDGLEDQDNAESALKCLLHQLLKGNSNLFTEEILKLLEELGEKRSKGFSSLWNIFAKISNDAVDTICILDALDECEAVGWATLAKALGNHHKSRKTGMRFIFFSRPYNQVRIAIRNGRIPHINLRGEGEAEVGKISAEINIVIRKKIEDLALESKLSLEEQEKVIQRLMKVGNRTYLWIHVICDMLEALEHVDDNSVEIFCERLPETVEDAYNKILLQSVDVEKAKVLLQIIVAAARPISVEEMTIAMAVNGLHAFDDKLSVMRTDNFVGTMRNICGLFVVVVQDHVYLIHQTAREFLIRGNATKRRLKWESSLNLEESNRTVMRICVWYLLNIDKRELLSTLPTLEELLDYSGKYVFFDYASRYWASHYRQSKMEESPEFSDDIAKLCDTHSTGFRFWYNYWLRMQYEETSVEWPEAYPESLEVASRLGIDCVAKRILAGGNYKLRGKHWSVSKSALCWAAASGSHNIVTMLLETTSKQPIFMRHGRLDIGLPLIVASRNGHKSIVETLLGADRASVSREDSACAIEYAAQKEYDSVVELLLSNENDCDKTSFKTKLKTWFRTRKSNYRHDPYQAFVEPLVQGANATALHTLLKSGKIDPNLKDRDGLTPLSQAAKYGHANVAHILLETGEVDVNSRDQSGDTPLAIAAKKGNLSIVEMLVATHKVNIHAQNTVGKTPLARAMEGGNPRIVHLLLTASNDREYRLQQSLISFAAAVDDLSLLVLLQQDWNAELKVAETDIVEESPIIVALKNGSKKVFKHLLDVGQLQVDFEYSWKSQHRKIRSTPLIQAAKRGQSGIIRVLLSRKANVNFRSVVGGLTALSTAVIHCRLDIVELLLRAEGLDLSLRCQNGLTTRLIARKLHDRFRRVESYGNSFRKIISQLNWYALSMPDRGEALRSLERSILENAKTEAEDWLVDLEDSDTESEYEGVRWTTFRNASMMTIASGKDGYATDSVASSSSFSSTES